MADFWQRLAARSLGETPTVQPAIAPLYAPGSLAVQPLDQTEESQDIVEAQPAIPAPQRVNLPPTSPFVELTRLKLSEKSLQPTEDQPLENRIQPDEKTDRIEPERTQLSIEPPEIEREPAPQRIDLAAQAPSIAPTPIAPTPIAPTPIAPSQTSLPTRSSSLAPVFRAANLASQTNSPTESQISTPSVQPIDKHVETEQPIDDRPSESPSTMPPSDILQSRQNSQPQPIEKAIVQSVLSIAPLIQVAQPQTNQSQIDQLPHAIAPIAETSGRRSSPAAAIPTIQVTIGRIEVRATPPTANRPKSSRSTPQLSLQDYLKQQEKQQDPKYPGGTR